MKDLMIIETREAIEVPDVEWGARLASGVKGTGARSCLMLVENGVLAVRAGATAPFLAALADEGVPILADRFALRERGIAEAGLATGVAPAELDVVIDWLDAGASVLWR